MRDLALCAAACTALLEQMNIPCGKVNRFAVNRRATTRWGQCKKEDDGFVIEISSVLLDERNPEDALMETILHELLHTCEGCQNHGQQWKAYAAQVNRMCGYHIKGRNSSEDKGIAVDTRTKHVVHRFECAGCGAVVERQRESKFTKNYRLYRCSKCGGRFRKIF